MQGWVNVAHLWRHRGTTGIRGPSCALPDRSAGRVRWGRDARGRVPRVPRRGVRAGARRRRPHPHRRSRRDRFGGPHADPPRRRGRRSGCRGAAGDHDRVRRAAGVGPPERGRRVRARHDRRRAGAGAGTHGSRSARRGRADRGRVADAAPTKARCRQPPPTAWASASATRSWSGEMPVTVVGLWTAARSG